LPRSFLACRFSVLKKGLGTRLMQQQRKCLLLHRLGTRQGAYLLLGSYVLAQTTNSISMVLGSNCTGGGGVATLSHTHKQAVPTLPLTPHGLHTTLPVVLFTKSVFSEFFCPFSQNGHRIRNEACPTTYWHLFALSTPRMSPCVTWVISLEGASSVRSPLPLALVASRTPNNAHHDVQP